MSIATEESTRPRLRWLGLMSIEEDHDCQARVRTDPEYVRKFSNALLDGAVFPPVTVFFDGSKYWLADGFHRVSAHRAAARVKSEFGQVRAEVHEGSKRDAMIFAAGANKEFSIERKPEDVQRALYLLLDDEDCFRWTSHRLANHVGCSHNVALRIRLQYCSEKGRDLPSEVEGSDGRIYSTRERGKPKLRGNKHPNGKTYYRAEIRDEQHSLGSDPERAARGFARIVEERAAKRVAIREPSDLARWFSQQDLIFRGHKEPSLFPGVSGFYGHGCIYTTCDFEAGGRVPDAVGRILLFRELALQRGLVKAPVRAVVLCYPDEGPRQFVGLARTLGIEFLTPVELLGSIKGRKEGKG